MRTIFPVTLCIRSPRETARMLLSWYYRRQVLRLRPGSGIKRRSGPHKPTNGTWLEGGGRDILLFRHWEYSIWRCWRMALHKLELHTHVYD